ncbi:MAG TPA: tetratricopeptide repeat protein, partial [Blastocatellia bacterium]
MLILIVLTGLITPARATPRERQASEAVQKIPEAARSCFARARAAESQSDWKTAETEYLKAIELSPTWVEAIANLGTVYNRMGRPGDAITTFIRATGIDPNVFGLQLDLGITYFKLGRYPEAEGPLRKAVSLDSAGSQASSIQASTLLMLALFAQDKYAEVTQIAEKLLSTSPDDPLVLETAGRAYFSLHDYKNAARTLQRRLTKKPETAELFLMLGQALDNTGDGDSAIAALERAIALSGDTPLPDEHFDLGYILWKQRQFDRAEGEFRKELSRAPDHAPSTY